VCKSCGSRAAGCLPCAWGLLGQRKNDLSPERCRTVDLDTLIVIDLTCLHGLRCVSERAPCVRAMCGAGQHAGELVHAQGRRSDHMCPRGDVHLLYIRCMTLNEIARLGKKSRLKVVRKKWAGCLQHKKPCVEDHLGDDWVVKCQWHAHRCNHVWRSLQSHPASHHEPFTLSQGHGQWWVFASKHLRWVTHMMSRRVSHVISEKGNPSHMWEGQLM
jgi:hypothetical protein